MQYRLLWQEQLQWKSLRTLNNEAGEPIDAADEYILHASGLEIVEDSEPVFRALIASYVHSHHFLHLVLHGKLRDEE